MRGAFVRQQTSASRWRDGIVSVTIWYSACMPMQACDGGKLVQMLNLPATPVELSVDEPCSQLERARSFVSLSIAHLCMMMCALSMSAVSPPGMVKIHAEPAPSYAPAPGSSPGATMCRAALRRVSAYVEDTVVSMGPVNRPPRVRKDTHRRERPMYAWRSSLRSFARRPMSARLGECRGRQRPCLRDTPHAQGS